MIHVSPGGDGDGSEEHPCGMAQVQATIERAQVSGDGDVVVEFADGQYEVDNTLRIRSLGGGDADRWVRLRAAEGARPVLCGGRPISGWVLHDEERGIWRADVPPGTEIDHLWWGHRRLTRAWSGWNPPGFTNSRRGLTMTGDGPDVATWANVNDVSVIKKMMWRKIPAAITGVDGDEICVDPHQRASIPVPSTALGVMEPFSLYGLLNVIEVRNADVALENAYELLTDEGEWYLDRDEATVFVKPFADSGFGPTTELIRPVVDTFVLLDGSMDSPVSNVELDGISFEYGRGTKYGVTAGFPTEPTAAITPRPRAALQINRGVGITLRNCRFLHLGYDAVHFDLGGGDYEITGNTFVDISRSAISLNQTNVVVSNRSKRGVLPENEDKFFHDVEIRNNYLVGSGIDAPAPAVG